VLLAVVSSGALLLPLPPSARLLLPVPLAVDPLRQRVGDPRSLAALPSACAPALGPEAACEFMVPVGAVGEAMPLGGACVAPQFGEVAVPMHNSFTPFKAVGETGKGDVDDDECELPARGRPRALSH